MGNDGGSIPDRRDLVKNKPKAEQADKANQTKAKWFNCALSKRPLQQPVVSCALGKLYNKDAILEYLLDKSAYGDGEEICSHIRSLKDVKTLKLTPNPAPKAEVSVQASTDRALFVCPLSLKEMNGVQPFVYLSTCGCVFSQAGLKALSAPVAPSSGGSTPPSDPEKGEKASEQLDLCPQCATKYSRKTNIVLLNPSPEEEDDIRMAMLLQRQSEASAKKSKKRKAGTKDAVTENESGQPPAKKKATSGSGASTPTPALNPKIAAVSRDVVASLAMEEAKRKATMTDAVKSLYGPADGVKRKETFMTMNTFNRYA